MRIFFETKRRSKAREKAIRIAWAKTFGISNRTCPVDGSRTNKKNKCIKPNCEFN